MAAPVPELDDLSQVADDLTNPWQHTYDLWGKRVSSTDPNATAGADANPDGAPYDYEFDGFGLPTSIKVPQAGTSTLDYTLGFDTTTGLLTSRIDPKLQKTCFEHDDLYRLTKVKYLCDEADEYTVDFTYDGNNNLTQMVDQREGINATTTHEYEETNLVTKSTEPNTKYAEYRYNADGTLTKFWNIDRETTNYVYDHHGRVNKVNPMGPSNNIEVRYDAGDRLAWIEYPGGSKIEYKYVDLDGVDRENEIMEIEITRNGTLLKRINYQRDFNGQATTTLEYDGSNTVTNTFAYDEVGWLIDADRTATTTVFDQSFVYNNNGNRILMTLDGTTVTSTHNAANWILTTSSTGATSTLTWDDNGSILTEGTTTQYAYSASNRLTHVTSSGTGVEYFYDGNNLRVKSDHGTTTTQWYYSPLGMLYEQENLSELATYVRLPDGQLLFIQGPDDYYYYFIDALENATGIIKEDGTKEWYDYHPFGEDITTSTTAYNPYRYKSTYRDDVNGKVLYYMINRYYDPVHGRFTQIDPIKEIAEFAFAGNNPIMYVDPLGLYTV